MDKVMTPFWNRCVEYLPMWMAPNMVTLIGFLAIVLSACQYLPFDLTLTKSFAPWCYAISSLSFFIYQTLDAVDGKQARRTGTSSPLGQLFDHGLDAWSTIFTIYSYAQILQIGATLPFWIYLLGMMSGFYTSNWEEYHTEVLRTSINGLGLTECQLGLCAILLV